MFSRYIHRTLYGLALGGSSRTVPGTARYLAYGAGDLERWFKTPVRRYAWQHQSECDLFVDRVCSLWLGTGDRERWLKTPVRR